MMAATGLSAGTLIRRALLNTPPPPATRRPGPEREALARLLAECARIKGELGKHGSNLNQIAYYLNSGRPLETISNSLALALHEVTEFYERDLFEIRTVIMRTMGYERGPDDEEE